MLSENALHSDSNIYIYIYIYIHRTLTFSVRELQYQVNSVAVDALAHRNTRDPFYWHGLTLIPARLSNHMSSKVWDEITYPFPNLLTRAFYYRIRHFVFRTHLHRWKQSMSWLNCPPVVSRRCTPIEQSVSLGSPDWITCRELPSVRTSAMFDTENRMQ